jgi:prepilin-type N-terminal cleavage/methylation domain-containing protein
MARNMRGFSLIELIIVVGIIGILAAIGTPMYLDYIKDSKIEAVKNNIRSIYLKNIDYKNENRFYYANGYSTSTDYTNSINNTLHLSLDNSDYRYYIRGATTNASSYDACAVNLNDSSLSFCIDEENDTNW